MDTKALYIACATLIVVGSLQAANTYLINLAGTPLLVTYSTTDNQIKQLNTKDKNIVAFADDIQNIKSIDSVQFPEEKSLFRGASRLVTGKKASQFDLESAQTALFLLKMRRQMLPQEPIAFIALRKEDLITTEFKSLTPLLGKTDRGAIILKLAQDLIKEFKKFEPVRDLGELSPEPSMLEQEKELAELVKQNR